MNTVRYPPQSEAPGREPSSYANRLIGVWRLVTYIDEHEGSNDTQPFGPESAGVSDLHGGWIRVRSVDEAGRFRLVAVYTGQAEMTQTSAFSEYRAPN
jgi:hypothetical protein